MYRVLIVDDDKLARMGLITIVPWESCGLEVVGDVSNGMKALEFLEEHTADLLIVDMSMPVLSGLDLIHEIQKRWPLIQFVVLSFHESFQYVQSALRLGVLDYISKIQIEQEDCRAIFTRVSMLLDEKLNGSAAVTEQEQASEELSEEVMEKLNVEWRSLYWVYDSGYFAILTEKTLEQAPSVRQMEHLLVQLLQLLEKTFCCAGEKIPRFQKIEDVTQWLRKYRDSLYEQVVGIKDNYTIPVCILHAVQYVRENVAEPLHADKVASMVSMSRGYFSKNFKKLTGQTFNDFLRSERVLLAKKILDEHKIPLTDIAAAVGYEDYKYFAHVFLEQAGMTLAEYWQQSSPQN